MIFDALKDKTFWSRVGTDARYATLLAHVKQRWEETRYSLPVPAMTYAARMAFYRTGDRKEFETPYFRRRNSLSYAALLALVYPEEKAYINYVHELIWAICDEYSWALPAHTKGDVDGDVGEIDLFNAETVFALAEICALLEGRLEPLLLARVRAEAEHRVFDTFKSRISWYETLDSNWAAVCAANVGGAMMYLDPALFEASLPRLLRSMHLFLGGFSEEGICMEGTSYWNYGFSNFAWFADMLYAYTNGRTDLFDDPRASAVASYMQKSFLRGNTTVSFSDGTRSGKVYDSLQYYLSLRYPDTVHLLPEEVSIPVSGNVVWMNLARAFVYHPDENCERHLPIKSFDFPTAGQAIVNEARYSLFVKAGHNKEQHNHNDVGSFILSTKAGQVFCDLGSGLYTREYFRYTMEERYSVLCCSSKGHSVPLINGQPQLHGREYGGSITHAGNEIRVDFRGAYGIEKLTDLTRRITHTGNGITLCDTFPRDVFVTERFVTTHPPRVLENSVRVLDVVLFFDATVTKPHISEEMHLMHTGGRETVYLIDFEIPLGATSACFDFCVDE